ncbi:MAG TPA: acyltransferase family protein [Micromonosporaceae bacterium]|nr:acyltransferase family protein [Micromonosporaceae bacterium]
MASSTSVLREANDRPAEPPRAQSRGAVGGPAPATRQRDSLLDNTKFLLILLVFVGHAIRPGEKTGAGQTLYYWIYLFHMPAFVLISGYLSKSYDGAAKRVDKLVTSLAVPYVIFWGIYALQLLSEGKDLPGGPLDPLWITWFLVALLVWRLTVPVWRRLRWPVLSSLAISLAAALVETDAALGLTRILSLLPFFVVGLVLQPHHLELLRRPVVRVGSAFVVIATMVLTHTHLRGYSREWVYWRETLADRDFEFLPYGIPARLTFLGLAFLLTAALLSLMPRRRVWFTRFGALTLYVYLLHGLVIRVSTQAGWYEYTGQLLTGHTELLMNITLAVVGTFLLCSPWVRKATRWAVEPKLDWILRRRDGGEQATASAVTEPAPGR